jgi:hypothetical protein
MTSLSSSKKGGAGTVSFLKLPVPPALAMPTSSIPSAEDGSVDDEHEAVSSADVPFSPSRVNDDGRSRSVELSPPKEQKGESDKAGKDSSLPPNLLSVSNPAHSAAMALLTKINETRIQYGCPAWKPTEHHSISL